LVEDGADKLQKLTRRVILLESAPQRYYTVCMPADPGARRYADQGSYDKQLFSEGEGLFYGFATLVEVIDHVNNKP
jgi:hypothetical protein